jgi:hypothetical protein
MRNEPPHTRTQDLVTVVVIELNGILALGQVGKKHHHRAPEPDKSSVEPAALSAAAISFGESRLAR